MKSKEDKTDKALHYIMGHIVLAYPGIIIAIFMALVLFGCKGEPPKPEDIALTRPMAGLEDDPCPVHGYIVKIETIPGSGEPLESASPLVMLLVDIDEDSPYEYDGALAQKQDNYKVGDIVEICYTDILFVHQTASNFNNLGFARKLKPHYDYGPSELEKYEKCQDELEECNEHVSTLIKAMPAKAPPSN